MTHLPAGNCGEFDTFRAISSIMKIRRIIFTGSFGGNSRGPIFRCPFISLSAPGHFHVPVN